MIFRSIGGPFGINDRFEGGHVDNKAIGDFLGARISTPIRVA